MAMRLMTRAAAGLPVLVMLTGTPAPASDRDATLFVEAMICGTDPHAVRASLLALPGVRTVAISLERKSAMVRYDDLLTTLDDMLAATASAGYAARSVE